MNKEKALLLIIFIASLFLGVGYATVNNVTLTIAGTGLSATNGDVKITNVTRISYSNVTAPVPVYGTHWTDTNLTLQISTNVNSSSPVDRYAVYEITITNDSVQNLVLGSDLFDPEITTSKSSLKHNFEVIGASYGDEVRAKSSLTFQIRITLLPSEQGNQTLGINATVRLEESQEGYLLATFKNNQTTGDLTGNNTVTKFTVTVMNSYQRIKEFNFSSSNDQNFEFVTANGTALPNYQIAGLTEGQDFDFYIKIKNGSEFVKSPQSLNIYLNPTDEARISIGTVSIEVPYNELIIDNEPPTITSFTATKSSTERKITISGAATDNMSIDHFDIFAYKNGSSTAFESKTGLAAIDCEFTNLENATYVFKVVAYDGKENSSQQSTQSKSYSWTYTVTASCDSNCTASPTSQNIEAGHSATITFTGKSGYDNNAPDIASATMTNSSTGTSTDLVKGTDYSYSNGSFVISVVTGPVSVSAEGVRNCLVEGTMIMLANGKTKKIEDIGYDDLLAIWNYDTGTISYEYPIWIEKEGTANQYTKITFSDNTYINIAYNHAFYDTDKKMFVNFSDKEIKVGTNIAKIDDNGEFKNVKITKIETINETVKYYFVASTRYYNVIANNILTTDTNKIISNLYGFMDNATWPSNKNELVNNNTIDYSYFKDILPYYMYKGFRVEEAGYLVKYNMIDINNFNNYIKGYITNDAINPISDQYGNRLWMVTTSYNNINEYNKKNYLKKEGSIYTLPKYNDVKYWYSTSENKYYKPGENIIVNHGMHFIAIK